jgi:protein-S-isoprenylcysteine O-methyltransferase Ste14
MVASARSSTAALVFAWCGAALFALSLIFFLYSYLIPFGRPLDHGDALPTVAIDVLLFTLFALHHSLLARPGIKARVRQHVPPALERSLYTWTASALFILVCALWQPVPGVLYRLTGIAAWSGYAVQLAAIAITVRASARLDVLDLAGVRQVLRRGATTPQEHVPLETTGLYGFVRHPLYFAWTLLVFGTPHMTATRAVFAVVSSAYLALAIPFEERSLSETFGSEYADYQRRVRWRMVPGLY